MTKPMLFDDLEYRRTLRHYATLVDLAAHRWLTADEAAELQRLSQEMTPAELARTPSVIEAVAEDYEQMRQVGDLGGAQLD